MDAEKYLKRDSELKSRIIGRIQLIEELKENATDIGSFDFSKDRVVSSTPPEAPHAHMTEEWIDLIDVYERELIAYKAQRRQIREIVEKVENEQERTLLDLHYLCDWEGIDIRGQMGISKSEYFRRKNNAIRSVQKILDAVAKEDTDFF